MIFASDAYDNTEEIISRKVVRFEEDNPELSTYIRENIENAIVEMKMDTFISVPEEVGTIVLHWLDSYGYSTFVVGVGNEYRIRISWDVEEENGNNQS
jgi:hypothetical protein